MSETSWPTTPCKGESCGEPIIWTVTTNNRPMPVSAEPSESGRFYLRQEETKVRAVYVPKRQEGGQLLYSPHWETCPNANDFRKAKSA